MAKRKLNFNRRPSPSGSSKSLALVVPFQGATGKGPGKKNRRRPPTSRIPAAMPAATADYMSLITNPCHGPLVRSVGTTVPGAIIERVRTTLTLDTSVRDCGYIVFYPSFHGQGPTANTPQNIYYFTTSTPGTAPVNSSFVPMGLSSDGVTAGTFVLDPIKNQINNTGPFSRAQALSACVQVDSLAALSTMCGQVAIVSNYSLAAFNKSSGGSADFQPPSVDDVFAYAGTRERLSVEGHEVRWRPSDHQAVMRTAALDDAGTYPIGPIADALLWAGSASGITAASKDVCVDPSSANGICIAWRGVPKSTSSLVINLVKVVALELAARNNTIEQIPTGASAETVATTIDSVVNVLDGVARGGWQIGKAAYDFTIAATSLTSGASRAMKAIESVFAPRVGSRMRGNLRLMNG